MFYSIVLLINVLLIPKCKVSLIAFSCRGLRLNLVVLLCHLAYQCLNLNIMDFIFMPLIFIWLIIVMIVPDYVTILFVQNIEDWTKTLFALYSSLRGEFYAQPRCLHQRRRFWNINFANPTVHRVQCASFNFRKRDLNN